MSDAIEPTVDAVIEEVAAPQEVVQEQEIVTEEGANDSANAEQKPGQDAEINAKFAEMRRKIEAAELREKEQNAWVEKTYGESHGIKTLDEYQRFIERERERAYYEERGVDPDVVDELVNKKLDSHPSVIAAKQREQEAFRATQMDKLNKTYGLDIKSVEDINKLPNGESMIQKIVSGYEWDEAYLVTHQEHITQNLAARAKQQTLNNQQSKAHLKSTSGGGDVDTFTMDPEVMANYRMAFSKELRSGKMTEKDLIAHYRKSISK